jgi:hypothetical protein
MFFVLSTGRCGSKSIAGLLDQFAGVSCFHEKQPHLAHETRAYLKGEFSRKQLIRLLKETRRPHDTEERYGESNQRFSYIIDIVLEAFPDAVFLWLVRNGLDVVASYYSRGAYRADEVQLFHDASPWVRHRLRGHEVSAMSAKEWERLDSFARNCWFWGWTNEKIKNDLQSLGAKWMLVRLEDLQMTIESIASFLQLSPAVAPQVPQLNVSPYGKVCKKNYWDHSQRDSFIRFCGPLMDELYPRWRDSLDLSTWQFMRNEFVSLFSVRHAFGRSLEKILKVLPSSLQNPIKKLSDGRRN